MAEVVRMNATWPQDQPSHGSVYTLSQSPASYFKPSFYAISDSEHRTYTFQVEQPNLFVCDPSPGRPGAPLYRHATWPTNIESFKRLWDQLPAPLGPIVVDSIKTIGVKGEVYHLSPNTLENISITSAAPDSTPMGQGDSVRLSLEGMPCESNFEPKSPVWLRGRAGAEFKFYVFAIKRSFIWRKTLIAALGAESTAQALDSDFEAAFPDLARATAGRSDMDFGTLAPQIYGEAARGAENFETFGMKFPSEQVSRWGFVILLGVQLYLLMYLKRFRNKLHADDPGWDSPWMAMDTSFMARSMLFVSLVVLPICAGLYMMVRAFSLMVLDPVDPVVEMISIFVAFCVTVALSILSWKYRPKLREPVAPPQVFE